MSERIAREVLHTGLAAEAVVVGSGTLEAAGIRMARDVDVIVRPEVFGQLRNMAGWIEASTADGQPMLTREAGDGRLSMEVATRWGAYTEQALRAGGFVQDGVAFAGLPHVYVWKQRENRPKDQLDLSRIRERVFDRLLPATMVAGELAFVRQQLPEVVREERLLDLAANGLYAMRTLYGSKAGPVIRYGGSYEQDVLATYHLYEHPAKMIINWGRQARRANERRLRRTGRPLYSPGEIAGNAAAAAYHDVVLGGGRQAHNPEGYDEKMAANVFARHLRQIGGYPRSATRRGKAAIEGTGFNEQTKAQDIHPSRGYVRAQQDMAALDVSGFSGPECVTDALDLVPEDMTRLGSGLDRCLSRKIAHINSAKLPDEPALRVDRTEDAWAVIADDPALRQIAADKLRSSNLFCARYVFPAHWKIDNPDIRQANADWLVSAADHMAAGTRSIPDILADAQRHAAAMRAMRQP